MLGMSGVRGRAQRLGYWCGDNHRCGIADSGGYVPTCWPTGWAGGYTGTAMLAGTSVPMPLRYALGSYPKSVIGEHV